MRKNLKLTTATALVTGLAALPVTAETVLPVADTFFDVNSVTAPASTPTNGIKSNLVIQGPYQALLRFDPKSLPGGVAPSSVKKATLYFWVSALVGGPVTLNFTDMAPTAGDGNWSEADSGFVQSTFNYIPAVGPAINPVIVTDKGRWYSVDVTEQLKGWLASPNNNSIQIINANTGSSAIVQIDSKENTNSSHPAFIDITLGVASVGVSAPITNTGTAIDPVIGITLASGNTNGYLSSTDWNTFNGKGSVSSVGTGTGLTGGPITTTGTISLANTSVTSGSYTYASLTVDAQGRLTAASSGTAPVTTVNVTAPVTKSGAATTPTIGLGTVPVANGGTGATTLTGYLIGNGGVNPVTASATIPTANITGLGSLATLNAVGSTQISDGSVTGTDIAANTVTSGNMTNSGVGAGSYTNANISVDAAGRVTAAANGPGTTVYSPVGAPLANGKIIAVQVSTPNGATTFTFPGSLTFTTPPVCVATLATGIGTTGNLLVSTSTTTSVTLFNNIGSTVLVNYQCAGS